MTRRFGWVFLLLGLFVLGSCSSLPNNSSGTGGVGPGGSGGTSGTGGGTACATGQTSCAGVCVDLAANSANCGACGTACALGQACVSGGCACPGGGLVCGGACTDTASSNANCGTCGTMCLPGEACAASACSCTAGLSRCGASCADVTSDPSNCGACAASGGAVCPAPQVCRTGSCATDCGTLTDCNRSCVNLTNDVLNCGACGNACPAGRTCQGSQCVCTTGMLCGTECVDTLTSPTNCGACGTTCSGGRTCATGACVCPTGQTYCGAQCTDTLSDTANCGACGAPCGSGQTCSAGRCMGGSGGAGGGGAGPGGAGAGGGGAGAGGAGAGGRGGAGAGGAGAGGAGAGAGGRGGAGAGAGGAGAGGAGAGGAGAGGGGTGGATTGCGVTSGRVRITEIDVGATIVNNEDEAALMPLSISPIPGGGSRLAWMGNDSRVHVTTLDANDQVMGASFGIPAHDFQDIYADANGGVILLTRDAMGGGTLNCGAPTNLCGTPPNPPIACYDMYLVRFNGSTEAWATKLTSSSAALPPYSTGPAGPQVYMIWWYAHHGRIVSDGTNFAAYFGAAISVTQSGCINIHQGDRAKIVNPSGAIVTGGFDWGCSHSGYERVVWDGTKYTYVCENDAPTGGKNGKIAFAPGANPVILPIDLYYTNMGDLVTGSSGGYWLTTSDVRAGQPAAANGLADLRLLHFTNGAPDQNLVLASEASMNDRAPHLAAYGGARMIAAWESATATGNFAANNTGRRVYVQTVSRASGAAEGAPLQVAVKGNRYQEFVGYPDGSVAYPSAGSTTTKIKILRILPCP